LPFADAYLDSSDTCCGAKTDSGTSRTSINVRFQPTIQAKADGAHLSLSS
jgi:hypothetical protein